MTMEINKVRIGNALVISIWGDIHTDDAETLRQFIKSPLVLEFQYILVDMLNTDYICSAGLRALLQLKKDMLNCNGHLRLVRPPREVYEVFEVSGLDKIFEFHQTASEALLEWIIPEGYKIVPIAP